MSLKNLGLFICFISDPLARRELGDRRAYVIQSKVLECICDYNKPFNMQSPSLTSNSFILIRHLSLFAMVFFSPLFYVIITLAPSWMRLLGDGYLSTHSDWE